MLTTVYTVCKRGNVEHLTRKKCQSVRKRFAAMKVPLRCFMHSPYMRCFGVNEVWNECSHLVEFGSTETANGEGVDSCLVDSGGHRLS